MNCNAANYFLCHNRNRKAKKTWIFYFYRVLKSPVMIRTSGKETKCPSNKTGFLKYRVHFFLACLWPNRMLFSARMQHYKSSTVQIKTIKYFYVFWFEKKTKKLPRVSNNSPTEINWIVECLHGVLCDYNTPESYQNCKPRCFW